jgi:hypothetical protein
VPYCPVPARGFGLSVRWVSHMCWVHGCRSSWASSGCPTISSSSGSSLCWSGSVSAFVSDLFVRVFLSEFVICHG